MSDTMKDAAMSASMGQARATSNRWKHPPAVKVRWSRNGGHSLLNITGLKTEPAPDLKVWLYQDQSGVKRGATSLKVAGKYFTVVVNDLPKDLGFNSSVLWCGQVSAAFGIAALKQGSLVRTSSLHSDWGSSCIQPSSW
ncbi:hypothetical protein GCM10022631_35420 [Deinococcus rubellus]|uniref:DM13 domain-containing protein n=1 Tax=Deinococcus rubellus TaxID=1889240 RepID=A0ABY5YK40_9DEIO|nr:DM13 domain-containing protein [Deinococcus rubellus]UWX64629.1 DM13 domain-containing protein [Deinococcus rubellus]